MNCAKIFILFLILIITYSSVNATIINIPDDYATVQAGIDTSSDGDTVLVQPGTYVENIDFNGHNIVLGSLFLTTGDTNYIVQTVIDGGASGTVISIGAGVDSTTSINGLTVQNGYAAAGAGIHCENANPILSDLIITDNTASNGGGGADVFGCNPTFIHCRFINNYAENYGGGLSNDMASPQLLNCVFHNNSTTIAGGGVSNYTYTYAEFHNCVIFGNTAASCGGMWNGMSFPKIVNCIIWGNENGQINGFDTLITYSDIQDGWAGEGNIDIDPLFRDPDNGDFHLMAIECGDPYNSPCIDMGHPDILDSLLDCDWGLGGLRSDMGAYGGAEGWVGIDDPVDLMPKQIALFQNYPNPFNASTTIKYELPRQSHITIEIYDILGRKVKSLVDRQQSAGYHQVRWQADDFSSGMYFYKLQAGDFNETKKMLLLK